MNEPRHYARFLVLAAALLCALVLPGIAQAEPVMVNATVTMNGSLFRYNYSITNNTPLDISAITISVLSGSNAVQNLLAPSGFNIFFDSGLGLVDFVENTQTFTAGTTVSGFRFDSLFASNLTSFTALALDANGNPVIFGGTTLAPAAAAPIPEPSTLLLALTSGGMYFANHRWRGRRSSKQGD